MWVQVPPLAHEMAKLTLSDINILDIGNEYHLVGAVWTGKGRTFIAQLPQVTVQEPLVLDQLQLTIEEWQRFLRQSDIQEVEILVNDQGNIKKSIVRKTARVIEGHVQWRVFKRDNYRCRYCGQDGIKLTIDHIDLWEDGGTSIDINLWTACSSCNNERGSMKYEDWVVSQEYKRVSKNLDPLTQQENLDKVLELPHIRSLRFQHIQRR